jgi:hypothetical protein
MKNQEERKKKKEELLHSILARFPSHVHSGLFLSLCLFYPSMPSAGKQLEK